MNYIAVGGERRNPETGQVEWLDPWDVAEQYGIDPDQCLLVVDDSQLAVARAAHPGARVLTPLYQPLAKKECGGCGLR